MLKYVDHVAYVVRDCDAMVEYFDKTFGMKPDNVSVYDYRTLTTMKEAIYDIGATQIQITEPYDWRNNPRSHMGKRVATKGPGVAHVGWGVEDVQKVAQELGANGTKIRANEEMLNKSPKGYVTINIDPASSHGLQFQLVAREPQAQEKQPMFKYVDHVHYAVQDRDDMIDFIEKTFGMKPNRLFEDPHNGKAANYDIGKTQLQVTSPTDPTSAIGKFLAKNGPGVFHLGWRVDNLREVAQEFAAKGTKMKMRGKDEKEVVSENIRGIQVCDIDPADSLGVAFRLVGG